VTTRSVDRGTLGLAAEYAVASELCRRNIYAQLTLGNQKRTDLLAFSESGRLARLEVKGKQGRAWPSCRGVSGRNAFLVFVDFAGKDVSARPDFYVLTPSDWRRVVRKRVDVLQSRNPAKRVAMRADNIPIFTDEIGKSGRPYRGVSVFAEYLQPYREKWQKIERSLGGRSG